MKLKHIKLAGFKSFADPTTIPIKDALTSIVGPNGCGKSNVIDAVKWVIGETSAKQLRGKTMADVIFNGTTKRPPMTKASVELCFDNSDKTLLGEYAAFSEIALRREVTKAGQSNYYLNGTHCRRRDIIDIFLGTGLGPRSYSIIEQGMISKIIEAKPEDLRVFMEEASGISKYKERRRETENRMRHTTENLERLADVREELGKQLSHLQRQAKAAERYQILKTEEREVSAQLKALQWNDLNDKLKIQDEKVQAENLKHDEIRAEESHTETEIEQTRENHITANDDHNEVQRQFYAMGADVSALEQRIEHLSERRDQWQTELSDATELWDELNNNTQDYAGQIESLRQEIAEFEPNTVEKKQQAVEAEQALITAEADMAEWQESWENFQAELSKVVRELEVSKTNIQHYEQQLNALKDRSQNIQTRHDDLMSEDLDQDIAPLAEKAEGIKNTIEKLRDDVTTKNQAIESQKQVNSETRITLDQTRSELQSQQNEHATLNGIQQAAMGVDDESTKAWLNEHDLSQKPRLVQNLKVDTGWEKAVETVMAEYFDAICVDNVSKYIQELPKLAKGNITLIDGQQTASSNQTNLESLSNKVNCEQSVAGFLVDVFVADDMSSALQQRPQLNSNQSIITKDGIWIGSNWVRIRCQDSETEDGQAASGMIEREQKIKSLGSDIVDQENSLSALKATLETGEDDLAQLELDREAKQQEHMSLSAELSDIQSELSAKQTRLEEVTGQRERLSEELTSCESEISSIQQQLISSEELKSQSSEFQDEKEADRQALMQRRDDCREKLLSARELAQSTKQSADELEVRLVANQNQLALLDQTLTRDSKQLSQLDERRDHLNEQLSQDDEVAALKSDLQEKLTARSEIEASMTGAKNKVEILADNLRELEALRSQLANKLVERQSTLDKLRMDRQAYAVRQTTIKEQLDEIECNLENTLEAMPEEANIKEWTERQESLGRKIQRLGPINLAAIDECQVLDERKTYLDKQNSDLEEALAILTEAIQKLDKETREKFQITFDHVNADFKRLFPRVFGGGRACLELDGEDVLTAGVTVKAQPPGKKNATIHMLSGGEKALTAISLVFSFFLLTPAPFCILDEVDAPLDDLNVGRFCQLVKEMSAKIQFIVISHNKVTIEMADQLMGITMQEPGVSRVVAVDMKDAVEMAEA